MLPLVRFFAQLCLLRAAPQDLPASQALLALVVLVNVVLGTILVGQALGDPFAALQASVLDTAILAAWVWSLLRFRNHPARFHQAATAAIGVNAVFALLSLPLQGMLPGGAVDPATMTPSAETASLLLLALVVWLQVALGHILRHALDTSLMLGIGLAFFYAVFSSAVIQYLFVIPNGS